ncbi:MAG: hypothetical protein IJS67_01035 [Clostridia bacterium]|nr:hypothetical protein [Clostridia bacterium]
MACHNHPTWSFEDESIAPAYYGCFAMEIYNHGSYQEGHDEYNRHYYDYQLNRGLDMALVASDDNHNPLGDEYKDAFGGATYILADKLEYGEIISALKNKEFYASTGPRIFSLIAEGGRLTVKTSEAERIIFATNNHHRKAVIAAEGKGVAEGEFTLNGSEKWVRVEIVDREGHAAFTRGFRPEELF